MNRICNELTGNQDENLLDIYHNKWDHHLHDMHHNSHDYDHDLDDDNMDVVAFYLLAETIHDYLADVSKPVSTAKEEPFDLWEWRKKMQKIETKNNYKIYLLALNHPMNKNQIHFLTFFSIIMIIKCTSRK